MRKEIRERQITEKTEVFIASDGSEFSTKVECENYEKSWECTIKASFQKVPQVKITEYELLGCYAGCEDYAIYLMKPRNLDDIRIINSYFILSEEKMFTQDDINKECVVGRYFDDTYGYRWDDGIETVINLMTKRVAEMRISLDNFGKEDAE